MDKPSRFRLKPKPKNPRQAKNDDTSAKEEAPFLAPTPEPSHHDPAPLLNQQTASLAASDQPEPATQPDPSADHFNFDASTEPQPETKSLAPTNEPTDDGPAEPIHTPNAHEMFHPNPDDQPPSQLLHDAEAVQPELSDNSTDQALAEETDKPAETVAEPAQPAYTAGPPAPVQPADQPTEEEANKPGLKTTHELTTSHPAGELAPDHHPNIIVKPPKTSPAVLGALLSLCLLFGLGVVWFNLNQSVYTLGLGQTNPTKTNQTSNHPQTLGAETKGPHHLNLSLGLKPLTQGHYQAWITQGSQTTALGSFNAQAAGPLKNLDGSAFDPTITLSDPHATIFVTIEAGNDPVQTPSQSVILTGTLNNGQANLKFTAIDLSKAHGVYTIATPTDPTGPNQASGIWFAHTDGKTLTGPGLQIPPAPAGWKYEGQAIYKGVSVEIGRFSKPDQADEFNKFAVNQDQVPPYPGEDFLQKAPDFLGTSFPTDLTTGDWQVVISIEPDQNGTDPTGDDIFFIQPFKADIPKGASTYKEYPLNLDLTTFPSGTAELN